MWNRLLSFTLVLAFGLAGCSGKSPDATGALDDVPEPAVAVFTILVNGTVLDAVNGTLGVLAGTNLTFDANASTGAQGVFLWDMGDGTKEAGPNVTHAYATAGLFNVTLTVGGGNKTSTTHALLNVTAPAPLEPVLLETIPFDFSGNIAVGNPNAPYEEGTDYVSHVVTIGGTTSDGTPTLAREVRISLDTSSPTVHTTTLSWFAPDGTALQTAGSVPGTADQQLTYTGEMAPGDYVVRVRLAIGANMDYTVTGEVDHYSA